MNQRNEQHPDEIALSVVAVVVDDARFGLPIRYVREVLRCPPVTPVPQVPAALRGVVSIRGEIVPVIDLGERLGLAGVGGDDGRLVLVGSPETGENVGLLVDTVIGLVASATPPEPPPEEAEASLPPGLVAGVIRPDDEPAISVLQLDRLLDLATVAREEVR